MHPITKYTLAGFIFGSSFPLIATIIELISLEEFDTSVQSVYNIHQTNPLHIIIDLAPFILATTGVIIGRQYQKLALINNRQEQLIKERTLELQDAIIKTKHESSAKTKFLSTVSHELRTPLNGIIGMNELLGQTELNIRQEHFSKNIKIAGETLLNILNDILDYSKLESGKLTIIKQPTKVKEEVQSVLSILNSKAEEKGLQLSLNCSHTLKDYYLFDGKRYKQILYNLVGNAIKFTHEGSIQITIDTSYKNEKLLLVTTITDTGIGIAKEKQEHVFDKFTQAEDYTEREYGGTGLGLSICKELSLAMNGDCTLESTPDEGSTFSVYFEIEETLQIRETPIEVETDTPTLPLLRILVAEDNLMNQELIKLVLGQLNYNPVIVNNGKEVLDALAKQHFNLLLMDVQMPKMNGIEAARNIREIMKNEQIIIVALTANAFEEDRQKCLNAGMNDFLTKPLNQTDLKNTILNYFAKV